MTFVTLMNINCDHITLHQKSVLSVNNTMSTVSEIFGGPYGRPGQPRQKL